MRTLEYYNNSNKEIAELSRKINARERLVLFAGVSGALWSQLYDGLEAMINKRCKLISEINESERELSMLI